jgi:putative flippase GtrA
MINFLKAQAVLIFGSIADFAITLMLVQLFNLWYVIANTFGNISGFILQFFLCREWVFNGIKRNIFPQVIKFVMVWAGSLFLSAAGIYFFTRFIGMNYILSKIITSVILGVTYNYLLLKKFVFR